MSAYSDDNLDIRISQSEETTVYFVRSSSSGYVKVGITYDVQKRIKQFRTGNPDDIELIASVVCKTRSKALSLERALHVVYAQKNVGGEWFNITRDDVDDLLQVSESYSEAIFTPNNSTDAMVKHLHTSLERVLTTLLRGGDGGVRHAIAIAEQALGKMRVDSALRDAMLTPEDKELYEFFDGCWTTAGVGDDDPFNGRADF